jgi:hypothetical protein
VKHSTGNQTKAEAARISRMLALGCIACRVQFGIKDQPAEVQHIVSGNRRMGHWYTIPLCPGHHRGVWPDFEALGTNLVEPPVSIASGVPLFEEAYGTQRELWEMVQDLLNLPKNWPESKIVPRVVA